MNSIDTDTIIQSIPLYIGALILIIYAIHCKKNKYEFNSEHVYGIIENCIAITAAIVLILAAYSEVFRRYILEFKIYLAVGGVLIAVMACKSLHRIFSNQYLGGRQTSNNSLFREKKDLLIVVDLQRDFCKDGVLETPNADLIIPSIIDLIRSASSDGCIVVLARDWHPSNHKSYKEQGGPFESHCVQGESGAKFHPQIEDLLKEIPLLKIVDIGSKNTSEDYSAFDDPRLQQIAVDNDFRTIYVVGIALEYCVLSTCLSGLRYNTPVVALKPFIGVFGTDPITIEKGWSTLAKAGVICADNYAPRQRKLA